MIKNVDKVSRGVRNDAERVVTLCVESGLLGQNAVPADRELRNVRVLARVGWRAVSAAFGVYAPVENIKKTSAGQQYGAARIGAARSDRESVDGDQVASIVINLEAA